MPKPPVKVVIFGAWELYHRLYYAIQAMVTIHSRSRSENWPVACCYVRSTSDQDHGVVQSILFKLLPVAATLIGLPASRAWCSTAASQEKSSDSACQSRTRSVLNHSTASPIGAANSFNCCIHSKTMSTLDLTHCRPRD